MIVAFSVVSPFTLEMIQDKWLPEIEHYFHNSIPMVLVGMKHDLRGTVDLREVEHVEIPVAEALQFAKDIGKHCSHCQ